MIYYECDTCFKKQSAKILKTKQKRIPFGWNYGFDGENQYEFCSLECKEEYWTKHNKRVVRFKIRNVQGVVIEKET